MNKEELSEMIEDCMNRESRLLDWETNFLESIEAQLAEKGELSEKQADKLETIWERITARG